MRARRLRVEGAILALYDPDKYRTSEKCEDHIEEMVLATMSEGDPEELRRGIERGRILAEATNFTRELVNEPSNYMTPTELARRARRWRRRSVSRSMSSMKLE